LQRGDLDHRCAPGRLEWAIAARTVVRVGALQRVVRHRQIASVAGESADVIEAVNERYRATAAEASVGRLEPVRATKRSGYADRAVGVRAERERNEPCGDRGR